ncbi:MAG TPA: TQO small subunit DoxD [Solirubrobacterales bacterium]|nr:TQO small subunit DoxD [Solirubrobacterales bacterium]
MRDTRPSGLTPGAALLPLRLFLGVTFVYAGIQKLSDPGFLHPGAPTYIGTQLHGFASGAPGGFILRTFAIPHAELAGVGVAILEIAIGLCVFFGLLTRLAAAAGLGLNLLLFLTASWHTTPYFLGPDIVFAFAWLPFVLTGARGQPALDHLAERGSPALARRMRMHPATGERRAESAESPALTRRALVIQMGLATLTLAGIAALAKGSYTGPAATAASTPSSSGSGGSGGGPSTTSGSSSGSGGSAPSAPRVPANAVKLGPSGRLATGQAAEYRDPASGQPDIVIRQSDGSLTAFSAVCTHAGCTVGYQSGEIVCPCHGGVYSATTGAVVSGPPPAPLASRKVIETGGSIYAIPS